MKALKFLVYFLLGLAAIIVLLGLFAKQDYHIERSIEIDAPKSMVYEQILRFKNFHEWSPWSKLDPNMKLTYSGVDGEAGASYEWAGNKDVGSGKQTLKTVGPDRLDLELQFKEPFESLTPVFFNIKGDSLKTKVTWGFDPHFPFPINIWAMFTDIDKAMGADYERGLGFLKRRCESIAHKKYNGYEISEEEIPEAYYWSLRKVVPFADITTFYGESLAKIQEAATAEKLTAAGAPTGLFWTYDETAGETDMAAAVPVKEDTKQPKDFQRYKLGGSKALVISFLGDYAKLPEAHKAMDQYMAVYQLQAVPPVLEEYITFPGNEPDTAKWLTKVIYFVETAPDSTNID